MLNRASSARAERSASRNVEAYERSTSKTQESGRYGYNPNERNGMSEQAIDKTRELGEAASVR